jgi:hypothetical protein
MDLQTVTLADNMKKCNATKDPPRVSHKWFVRANRRIQPAEIVEEPEIVIDFKDESRYRHCQSSEIDPANPFRILRPEEWLWSCKERFDLEPCDDIMGEV